MRNFGNEEPDEFRLDGFFDMDENNQDEFEHLNDGSEIIGFAQIDLMAFQLNQKLLKKAVDLAEKSLFWRFRSLETKLKKIETIYQSLKKLLEEQEEEE